MASSYPVEVFDDFGFAELEIGQVYGAWISSLIGPYLGKHVWEIGCGIGSFIPHYQHASSILAVDIHPEYISQVKKRFSSHAHIHAQTMDIVHLKDTDRKKIKSMQIDSAIMVNVLEHIREDVVALRHIYDLLPQGGTIAIFVPAHQWLYGTLDEAFGHVRRYEKRELSALLRSVGFRIIEARESNSIGIIWWWIVGKILKKRNLPHATGSLLQYVVPVVRWIEGHIQPPIGQSLIVIGKK